MRKDFYYVRSKLTHEVFIFYNIHFSCFSCLNQTFFSFLSIVLKYVDPWLSLINSINIKNETKRLLHWSGPGLKGINDDSWSEQTNDGWKGKLENLIPIEDLKGVSLHQKHTVITRKELTLVFVICVTLIIWIL
jgi:hypothetical protein